MRQHRSVYYPPRARWYGRFMYVGNALLGWLPLQRLRLPRGMSAQQVVISLVLPGFIFFVLGHRRAGRIVLGVYALCFLITLVWLGSAFANGAFMVMVALHGTSWAALVEAWLGAWNLESLLTWHRRLLQALAATLVAAILFYLPLQRFVQRRLVMPMSIAGHTILVVPEAGRMLQPGETGIFRVEARTVPGVHIADGFVIAKILGKAGDHVYFEPGLYRVGGVRRPALPLMPVAGEWVVPENHWFIWPFSGIGIQGNLNAANLSTALLQDLAFVPTSHAMGRPVRRWFWRSLYVP